MTVGERIKNRRIELGMSQTELALKMGYTGKSSISKAETRDNAVTTTTVKKFAEALGVSEYYLLGWEDMEGKPILSDGARAAKLVKKYSKLSEAHKDMIDKQIDLFIEMQQEG